KESDDRRRSAGDFAEHRALLVLDRLRTGDAARVQMLHQAEEERQVLGGDALLVEREDEVAAAGVDQEVRVLDPFGDGFVGEHLPDLVAGEKGGEVLGGYIGVDGHDDSSGRGEWRMASSE